MNWRATDRKAQPTEFLRLEYEPGFEDADPADPDGIEWVEDVAASDELAGRPHALPAPTTRHRLASLLLLGAVLASTGYGANRVYHRDLTADLTADAASDELILATAARGGLSLPGLADAGAGTEAAAQSGDARAEVAVALVNRSPGAVTLLPGATLLGKGLSGSSLGASAPVVLAPGQSTVLRGYVTADCADAGPDHGTAATTSLMVSARTSGGGLGVGTVALGSAGGSVRDRICAARPGTQAQ